MTLCMYTQIVQWKILKMEKVTFNGVVYKNLYLNDNLY